MSQVKTNLVKGHTGCKFGTGCTICSDPKLQEFFTEAGIAFCETCQRFGGKVIFYNKMLSKFVAEQGSTIDKLHKFFVESDFANLGQLAHSYKGVCLNLGFNSLAELAQTCIHLVDSDDRVELKLTIEKMAALNVIVLGKIQQYLDVIDRKDNPIKKNA